MMALLRIITTDKENTFWWHAVKKQLTLSSSINIHNNTHTKPILDTISTWKYISSSYYITLAVAVTGSCTLHFSGHMNSTDFLPGPKYYTLSTTKGVWEGMQHSRDSEMSSLPRSLLNNVAEAPCLSLKIVTSTTPPPSPPPSLATIIRGANFANHYSSAHNSFFVLLCIK